MFFLLFADRPQETEEGPTKDFENSEARGSSPYRGHLKNALWYPSVILCIENRDKFRFLGNCPPTPPLS